MHPRVSNAMRQTYEHVAPSGRRSVALIRDPNSGREIENHSDVYSLAQQHGFDTVETGRLDFADQVSLFRGAERLIGVLGSDFANLLFSPEAVSVITMAPGNFGDRFFYALVLDRGGTLIDLRGPVVRPGVVWHKSTFRVDVAQLEMRVAASAGK